VANSWKIKQAANIVLNGGVIAYPTEAVYGLGCDPYDDAALQRLLHIKQRHMHKGVILVAAEFQQLIPFINMPSESVRQKICATWPGPVTWLIPAAPGISPLLTGAHSTLAVRISAHPLVQALCREINQPIVSTSANRSSAPPARSALTVQRIFGQELDFILHGTVDRNLQPSEIRDARTDQVIRPGTSSR